MLNLLVFRYTCNFRNSLFNFASILRPIVIIGCMFTALFGSSWIPIAFISFCYIFIIRFNFFRRYVFITIIVFFFFIIFFFFLFFFIFIIFFIFSYLSRLHFHIRSHLHLRLHSHFFPNLYWHCRILLVDSNFFLY